MVHVIEVEKDIDETEEQSIVELWERMSDMPEREKNKLPVSVIPDNKVVFIDDFVYNSFLNGHSFTCDYADTKHHEYKHKAIVGSNDNIIALCR